MEFAQLFPLLIVDPAHRQPTAACRQLEAVAAVIGRKATQWIMRPPQGVYRETGAKGSIRYFTSVVRE